MSTSAFQVIDGVPTYNLFIGGEWIPSSRNEAAASYNPATGELYARVHQAGARETVLAIEAAHAAYRTWAEKVVSERETVFLRAADVLAAKSKEIIDVLIEESGSVAGKAGFEVGYCFDLLRTAASELRRSPGETMATTMPGQFGFTIRQPLGVIAGIAPFNAPFLLARKKLSGHGLATPSRLRQKHGLRWRALGFFWCDIRVDFKQLGRGA
jgi:vanillin dehydrogenase